MRNKLLLVFAIIVVVTLTFGACGSGSSGANPPPKPGNSEVTRPVVGSYFATYYEAVNDKGDELDSEEYHLTSLPVTFKSDTCAEPQKLCGVGDVGVTGDVKLTFTAIRPLSQAPAF